MVYHKFDIELLTERYTTAQLAVLRNISPFSLPLVTESCHYNTIVTEIASICQFLLE